MVRNGHTIHNDNCRGLKFLLLLIACSTLEIVGQIPSYAQSCPTGNEAIVNLETFGAGPAGPLTTGRMEYRYVTDGCPNDGQYTVIDSVSGKCYTSSWHSVPQDHTPGDVRGNMLVINAPYPGEFYRQSFDGICSGTTYLFSMWLVNLNIEMPAGTCGFAFPQDPNITIRAETLDGRLIDSMRTGQLVRTKSPVWRQIALLFTVPMVASDTTTVVLRFINNENGGCGNDFALDDLTLKQCSDCRFSPIFVPDAFTPNGDGINDLFAIFYRNPLTIELAIYDRWGNVIFTSRDPAVQWNGTYSGEPCDEGIYAWALTYEMANPSGEAKKYRKTGQVLLMR